jgi:hypothetical protein
MTPSISTALRCMPVAALAIGLGAAPAGAQTIDTSYQYSPKAVCSLLGTFGDGALAQGTYRTLINVGNPSEDTVEFAVLPVVAGSLGQPSGGIGGVVAKRGELAAGAALSIDCGTIAGFFCPTADGICFDFSAIDGFVRINAPVELDVVGIYTARPAEGEVAAMDVEAVEGRAISKTVEVADEEGGRPAFQPRMQLRNRLEAE